MLHQHQTVPNQAMGKDTTTSPKASGLKSHVSETQGRNLNQEAVSPMVMYQKAVDKTIPRRGHRQQET
jgi:hypothetical protein